MITVRIPLPPLAEQRRIVAKVDELMALCDRLEEARAERESRRDRLATSTLTRLASKPLDRSENEDSEIQFALATLPWTTTETKHVAEVREAILRLAVTGRLLPSREWATCPRKLREVARLQNGYAFKSEWFEKDGVRLLRNANVSHDSIVWRDVVHLSEERASEYNRFRLEENDIVLSLDRPFIATGTKVARVCKADLPSLLLQRVGRFQFADTVLSPDWLLLWVQSSLFAQQIDPGRSNGVPHVSAKDVESASIYVPPLAEQHRIVTKAKELIALCDRLAASLIAGAEARRALLEATLRDALAPALAQAA